jgi:drug/metabolite transporter (DMT)-like permease
MPSGACCLFWARWFSSAQPFDASRDTGASRAGAFAFVSPVIAVLLGVIARGEKIGPSKSQA